MFKLLKSKKGIALLAVLAVAAVAAVGAYAYWTTTGTGSGSATVGTAANSVVLTGTTSGLLYPGGPSRTVSFTAANPETSNQSVSSIHLVSVAAYSDAGHTVSISGCGGLNSASSDFQMADVPVNPATDGDIAPGATAQPLTASGQLVMNNLDSNQDACKNAYLVLSFTTA